MPHVLLAALVALPFFAIAGLLLWKGPRSRDAVALPWIPAQWVVGVSFVTAGLGVAGASIVMQKGAAGLNTALANLASGFVILCLVVSICGLGTLFVAMTKYLDKEVERARTLFWIGMVMLLFGLVPYYAFSPH